MKIHANFVLGITVDMNKVLGIWFYFHVYFSIGCHVFWKKKWSFGIDIYKLNCIFALFHPCYKEIDKTKLFEWFFYNDGKSRAGSNHERNMDCSSIS